MAKKGKLKKFQAVEKEERPIRFRRYQYLFLIVCEDENTEPTYFENFKIKIPEESIYLRPVGTGKDPKGVVEEAVKEKAKLSIEAKKEVDVVWAVFDKDDADFNQTRINRFNEAFEIAEKNKIEVAYSNEVFEVWLLLHLTDIDEKIAIPRKEIYQLLQEKIRLNDKYSTFEYEHGNANILPIINEIGNQDLAIERAKLLLEKQHDKKPIEANPSTKIHILVQDLLTWIEYYSYKP
jgi:hypothetical protein